MRHYDFLHGGVGVIDPGVVVNVATSIFDFASNIFGKDEVPNYPIKSGNTYNKLVGIVNQNVPGVPTTVAQAQDLLQKAQAARQLETQGDGGSANRTIIMMYDEVIAALQTYIARGGGVYTYAPGSGSGTTLPANTQPVPGQYTAGANNLLSNPLLIAGAAGLIVYLATRKKSRR